MALLGDARLPERFWDKVCVTESGCWEWTAATFANGYGVFKLDRKTQRAHRVAYTALVGPIPDGLVCDHLCRNVVCVNPEHIEPVTDRVNVARGNAPSAFNLQKTHCIRNHELTPGNVYVQRGTWRNCKTCTAMRGLKRRDARRAAKPGT